MNTLTPLIIRIIYFAFILLLTLWIGIIVYAGLAMGDYLWTIAIGCVYFFAVLPVLMFGFHRLKKTASPSKKHRIGYFLVISILAIVFLPRLIIYSGLINSYLSHDPNAPYGNVCFQVVSDQADKSQVWIDWGNPKIGFSKFYKPIDKNIWCEYFPLSRQPLQIKAYSVTDKISRSNKAYQNRYSNRATEDDHPTEPFNVSLVAGKTTCVIFSPITPTPNNSYQWVIKEVSCTP